MIMEAVASVVMASWFGSCISDVCFYSGRNGLLGYLTSWAPVVLYLGRGDGLLVT